jgi:hypothetical protein
MKLEQNVPETLAFKLHTPVNRPEESIQHSEHGKSLKSKLVVCKGLMISKGSFSCLGPYQVRF